MHIAIWTVAALAFALWSLLSWGVLTVLGLDPSWVGDLKPLVAKIPYGDILETWIPAWQQMLLAAIDLTRAALLWMGGAGKVMVWFVWGLGVLCIVLFGALLSGLVALARRAEAPKPPQTPAAA